MVTKRKRIIKSAELLRIDNIMKKDIGNEELTLTQKINRALKEEARYQLTHDLKEQFISSSPTTQNRLINAKADELRMRYRQEFNTQRRVSVIHNRKVEPFSDKSKDEWLYVKATRGRRHRIASLNGAIGLIDRTLSKSYDQMFDNILQDIRKELTQNREKWADNGELIKMIIDLSKAVYALKDYADGTSAEYHGEYTTAINYTTQIMSIMGL